MCERGAVYVGEILVEWVEEHKINVKEGTTLSSKLAEHVWSKQHKVLWDDVEIVGTEKRMTERKIKEASFLAICNNCISQAGKNVP